MKRRTKVDLGELEIALTWHSAEASHFLDLETGQVIMVTDEARSALEKLWEEMVDEQEDQIISLEELLQQRDDIQDWFKDSLLEADRVEREYGSRYVSIEPDDPYQDYNDMDNFIATLDNDRLQDELWRAIRGRGAFRRFKEVVGDHPHVQEQWYAYKNARAQERVHRWLEDHDIEPVT